MSGTIIMRSVVDTPFDISEEDGSYRYTIRGDDLFKCDEKTAKRLEKEHKARRL